MDLYTGKGDKITIGNAETTAVMRKAPWDTVIHRGWVSGANENTIPAFYLAKENGYDWVECDVRFSSDGVPVLSHDPTIVIVDGDDVTILNVAESTAEQLQSVPLQFHERFGDNKLATLAQLLDMARLIGLSVLIDIKANGTEQNMKDLAQTVLSSGWSRNVVYMPTSVRNAQYIASVDRNASFDFVIEPTTATDFAPYQALLTGGNTVAFDMQASTTDEKGGVDTAVTDAVRAAGLSVCFWNVRTSAYQTYMDAGPLRITKQNTADAVDLDAAYLQSKSFF